MAPFDLRKNHGKEEMRARDLFYVMWTQTYSWRELDAEWSLNECPDLHTYGDEFRALYAKYESEGRARKTTALRTIDAITLSQIGDRAIIKWMYATQSNQRTSEQSCIFQSLCAMIIEQYSTCSSLVT